uniref:Nonstructural polyprotein n=1 Tax=Renmark bee virus 3 TaxID=2201309 RepID=A0A2U8JQ93_9VIRU|nr:nonstructural polyprotein [Renmark bee virus 3]
MFSRFFKAISCQQSSIEPKVKYDVNDVIPLEVSVLAGDVYVTLTVTYDSDLYEMIDFIARHSYKGCHNIREAVKLSKRNWRFAYLGKVIPNRGVPLSLYNVRHGAVISILLYAGKGGSHEEDPEPLWFKEIEDARFRQVAIENERRSRKRAAVKIRAYLGKYDFELQSSDEESSTDSTYDRMLAYVFHKIKPHDLASQHSEFLIKIFEDISILMFQLTHAKTKTEMLVAAVAFMKLRTGKSIYGSINYDFLVEYLSTLLDQYEVQSFDETFVTAREFLDKYEALRNAPIFKKLYKFCQYALSMSLFEWAGISFSKLNYTKIEEETVRREFHMGPDFLHCMFDTLIFLCERGFQCMKSGNLDPIYHSGTSYEKWYDRAMELRNQSKLMSDPEAHGINKFAYLKELQDVIEQGRVITKYAAKLSSYEKSITRVILGEMETLKCTELSKRAAQKSRRAPFPMLLSGGSSVGKSTILDLIFYQFAKTFDLPRDSEFRYTRICTDPYWSGFDSSMWFVTVDDVAAMNPNVAVAGGDPSLLEILNMLNRIPFVTTQAELSDKGRVPFRAKCVVATTNTPTLNAHAYFSCPLAIQRRLPWVVDCKPKDAYTKLGQMLDSTKVPDVPVGEIPDFWDFTIFQVVPVVEEQSSISKRAQLVERFVFNNVHDFLAWVSTTAIEFENNEKCMEQTDAQVKDIEMCPLCFKAKYVCKCVPHEMQNDDEVIVPRHIYLSQEDYDNLTDEDWRTTLSNFEVIPDRFSHLQDEALNTAMRGERIARGRGSPADVEEEIQSELISADFLDGMIDRCVYAVWMISNAFYFDRFLFHLLMNVSFTRNFAIIFFRNMIKNTRICKRIYGLCGTRVRNRWFLSTRMNRFADALLGGIALVSLFHMISKAIRVLTQVSPVVQGAQGSSESGFAPKPMEGERVNVWYKDDYQVTNFDVSPMTTSYARFNPDEVLNVLSRNCVSFESEFINVEGLTVKRTNKAICLAGHVYLVNNHGIPDNGDFKLTITQGLSDHGVNSNITILVTQCEVRRYPGNDMATIYIRAIPPMKDITGLLVKDTFRGKFNATYLIRGSNGDLKKTPIQAVNLQDVKVPSLNHISISMWVGVVKSDGNTVGGDCGSMMVAQTKAGPIIVGFHLLGHAATNSVCAARITQEMAAEYISAHGEPIVQSGVPLLSSESVKRVVSQLHYKSTVRYLEEGTANVYGSFLGFRPAPRSSVGPTLVAPTLAEHGYETKFGPPVMSGWAPWRIAIKDMTKPVTQMRTDILEICADSFYNDIISNLPADWKDMVHVYDDFTAINGAAGVAYVDKMNRNTSAGNPWKKGKKHFLRSLPPRGENLEPVQVTEEVMNRVQICIETYHSGQRYMPNFCGHLKDEATKFAKIEQSKTRVFTGAPFCWSIAVRKYLLSSIRLIQNNRFVFEAAVGTNAHSLEWQEMRQYLTVDGSDRMIAGDYAAFDKRMSSTIILLSFKILYRICEASGNYSANDLKVVAGIAEDTAFPLIEFNGDLIEFFGSNPSGHPLTVIINGIANSLYMRYCYHILNPDNEVKTFKQNVHLMTYGDDNAMGVNPAVPWFNHTSIQNTLAECSVKYTMADKEAVSVPYIDISEVSFLKRTWRFDEDIGAFVCPLEHDSIEKSLMVGVVSNTITQEEQCVDIMSSAAREYFWYGKDIFNAKRLLFQDIIQKHELEPYTKDAHFPNWQQLYCEFWGKKYEE